MTFVQDLGAFGDGAMFGFVEEETMAEEIVRRVIVDPDEASVQKIIDKLRAELAQERERREKAEKQLAVQSLAGEGADKVTGEMIGDLHVECEATKRDLTTLRRGVLEVAEEIYRWLGPTEGHQRLKGWAKKLRALAGDGKGGSDA